METSTDSTETTPIDLPTYEAYETDDADMLARRARWTAIRETEVRATIAAIVAALSPLDSIEIYDPNDLIVGINTKRLPRVTAATPPATGFVRLWIVIDNEGARRVCEPSIDAAVAAWVMDALNGYDDEPLHGDESLIDYLARDGGPTYATPLDVPASSARAMQGLIRNADHMPMYEPDGDFAVMVPLPGTMETSRKARARQDWLDNRAAQIADARRYALENLPARPEPDGDHWAALLHDGTACFADLGEGAGVVQAADAWLQALIGCRDDTASMQAGAWDAPDTLVDEVKERLDRMCWVELRAPSRPVLDALVHGALAL